MTDLDDAADRGFAHGRDQAVKDAEQRGRDAARLGALEDHARAVNGNIGRLTEQIISFREEWQKENLSMRATLVAITSEKRGVVSLQNRQVAFIAAIGTVIFLLVEHVH